MTANKTKLLTVTLVCIGGMTYSIHAGYFPMFALGLLMGIVLCICAVNVIAEEE